jgi:hypothetical protein
MEEDLTFMFPFVYMFQICERVCFCDPRTMSDMKVLVSLQVLQALMAKVPRIVLQRAEQIVPVLAEETVSALCMK